MRPRHQILELRRGHALLTIAPVLVGDHVRYVGRINGRSCVTSPTRQGALQSLLRRVTHSAIV